MEKANNTNNTLRNDLKNYLLGNAILQFLFMEFARNMTKQKDYCLKQKIKQNIYF